MNPSTGIHFESVSRSFDSLRALDDFALSIPRGSFYGLLGRNGAGKTTALRVALGLLSADHGRVRILDGEFARMSPAQRSRIAYVAQEPRLPARLTLAELGRYLAGLYPRFDLAQARTLAVRFEVPWDQRFGQLSVGAKRKAAALLALATRAEVLLLDEPAAALDPIARREFHDVLVESLSDDQERTVLLSTHLVGDLERLAEGVAFVDHGRVVFEGDVEDLRARFRRVQVAFHGTAPERLTIPGIRNSTWSGSVLNGVTELESESDLDELRALPEARVEVFPMSLEEIFIDWVGPSPTDLERVLTESEEARS